MTLEVDATVEEEKAALIGEVRTEDSLVEVRTRASFSRLCVSFHPSLVRLALKRIQPGKSRTSPSTMPRPFKYRSSSDLVCLGCRNILECEVAWLGLDAYPGAVLGVNVLEAECAAHLGRQGHWLVADVAYRDSELEA